MPQFYTTISEFEQKIWRKHLLIIMDSTTHTLINCTGKVNVSIIVVFSLILTSTVFMSVVECNIPEFKLW